MESSTFCYEHGKNKHKHKFSLLWVATELLSSPVHLKVFMWLKESTYFPRGVFMFIKAGSEGGMPCTLPESIPSASHITGRQIQNEKLSEQLFRSPLDSLMSKALSHERKSYKGAVNERFIRIGSFAFPPKEKKPQLIPCNIHFHSVNSLSALRN